MLFHIRMIIMTLLTRSFALNFTLDGTCTLLCDRDDACKLFTQLVLAHTRREKQVQEERGRVVVRLHTHEKRESRARIISKQEASWVVGAVLSECFFPMVAPDHSDHQKK